MEVPFFGPENLTGFGAFITLAFWNVWSYMSGRAYSRSAVQDMQKQYDERLREKDLIITMWQSVAEKKSAALDLRSSAENSMMVESIKTVAHALEAIQAEGREKGVGHVPSEDAPESPSS